MDTLLVSGASRRTLLKGAALLPLSGGALGAAAPPIPAATSPDGRVRVTIDPAGPLWSVTVAGRAAIVPSPLGLVLAGGARLGPGARLRGVVRRRLAESWSPPYGIRARYDGRCEEVAVEMEEAASGIRFAIVARAYDAGAAVRFRLLAAPSGTVMLEGEATEFRVPADATVYASRDEGEYQRTVQTRISPVPVPSATRNSDPGDLADVPLTVRLADGGALLIGESDRLHYPRAMLRSAARGIAVHLMRYPGRATGPSGPGDTDPEPRFAIRAPSDTPWRVVIAAPDAAGLIERQDLVTTLASPNRLGDVSWIRPGRAIRIVKYTTQAGMDAVDFAAARKLDYVEWDAHWYGDGTDPSDATRPIPAIDIRRVIDYARGKGIGMILYVDRVPMERQRDAIMRTYRKWGVAGIKFGFIWEGRQRDTDYIYSLLKICGENRLLVDLHDNLRPAGLERTLPNYVAQEGVRGNEQFPTAAHNCTLPFARALAGPIDYTICFANSRNKTTNAHQLALAAIYYNPLTFLYWYDNPSKYAARAWPELCFFDECPTSWAETVALSGAIGEHAAVARRAKDGRWFVGAITDASSRTLTLDLARLGPGPWRLRRFADGVPAENTWQTPVLVTEERLARGARLTMRLAPSGGQALILERI